MIAKTSICLVGAGPVGSLMSVLLARRGFDVTVYERRPDMRRVDIPAGRSINLALANRGINALEKVGLMNEIGKYLIPMRGRMIHDEAGNVSLQPYGNKAEEIIYSVSRGELNKTLMNVAQIRVKGYRARPVSHSNAHMVDGFDIQHRDYSLLRQKLTP